MDEDEAEDERIRRSATLALLVAAGLILGTGTAFAVDTYNERSCSAGGFTGYIQIHYSYASSGASSVTIRYYNYRINKGGNTGGNNADIGVSDNGVAPARQFATSTGIQDNSYHTLADPTNYNRPTLQPFGFHFTFDLSGASDPSCTGSFSGLTT